MNIDLLLSPLYAATGLIGLGLITVSALAHDGHGHGHSDAATSEAADLGSAAGLLATLKSPRHAVIGSALFGLAGLGADLSGLSEGLTFGTALLSGGLGGVLSATLWRALNDEVRPNTDPAGRTGTVILPSRGTREDGNPARVRVIMGASSQDFELWTHDGSSDVALPIGTRVRVSRGQDGQLQAHREELNLTDLSAEAHNR